MKINDADDLTSMQAVLRFLKYAKEKTEESFLREVQVIRPDLLFSIQRLQNCLRNPLLTPEWFQVSINGNTIDLTNCGYWKNVQTKKLLFTDKSAINHAIEAGGSLVLEGIDILDSEINTLLSDLDQLFPCVLSNCVAFFSQNGSEAYQGHRDSDDVLVLQIAGEKRWNIHVPQQRRFFGNAGLSKQAMGPILADFVMQPGDALFVKAGVPHRCITQGRFSLHLSIDLCDRSPNIEQITHVANQLYNSASANPHVDPEEVLAHYMQVLSESSFLQQIAQATTDLKTQATAFRLKIRDSNKVDALNQFK